VSERPAESRASGVSLAVAGALAAVLCCALPALVASGTLASVGAVLGNPWLWVGAIALLGAAVVTAVRHRPSARAGRVRPDARR
jgi:mercuric ion transport protein